MRAVLGPGSEWFGRAERLERPHALLFRAGAEGRPRDGRGRAAGAGRGERAAPA